MKRLLIIAIGFSLCYNLSAQDNEPFKRKRDGKEYREEPTKESIKEPTEEHRLGDFDRFESFDRKRLFIGGTMNLGYNTGYDGAGNTVQLFNIGGLPEIGHRFSKYLDAGLASKINYYSQKTSQNSSISIKSWYYGLGIFARATVYDRFFLQVMPESNLLKQTQNTSNNSYKYTIKTSSLLLGGGYKYIEEGSRFFYYVLILVDVNKDPYSPYVTYTQSGQVIPVPVFRVGINYFPFKK